MPDYSIAVVLESETPEIVMRHLHLAVVTEAPNQEAVVGRTVLDAQREFPGYVICAVAVIEHGQDAEASPSAES